MKKKSLLTRVFERKFQNFRFNFFFFFFIFSFLLIYTGFCTLSTPLPLPSLSLSFSPCFTPRLSLSLSPPLPFFVSPQHSSWTFSLIIRCTRLQHRTCKTSRGHFAFLVVSKKVPATYGDFDFFFKIPLILKFEVGFFSS